jgi:hypothetical protein
VIGVPLLQTPPPHVSPTVHALPSLQTVPSATWFVRQVPDPLHVSALSHDPLDGSPHAVPAVWKPSAGQAPDDPVQLSATSH